MMNSRKDLRAIRKLMERTGMLEVYAEQVHAGAISYEEGLRRSFGEIKKLVRGLSEDVKSSPVVEKEEKNVSREILLTFKLKQEDLEVVNEALEKARTDYNFTDKNNALLQLAKKYLGME